jgi:hypothetical protein
MLPSGNDAAICIAEHFGRILLEKRGIQVKDNQKEDLKFDKELFFQR